MANQPFQVTVTEENPETGKTQIMWNIQAANVDAFVTAIQDLGARVPSFRERIGDVFNRAQVRAQLTGDAATNVVNMRATPPEVQAGATPRQPEPVPTCPKHQTSKRSRFYDGLMCPRKEGDKYCEWKHECSASCTHAAAA